MRKCEDAPRRGSSRWAHRLQDLVHAEGISADLELLAIRFHLVLLHSLDPFDCNLRAVEYVLHHSPRFEMHVVNPEPMHNVRNEARLHGAKARVENSEFPSPLLQLVQSGRAAVRVVDDASSQLKAPGVGDEDPVPRVDLANRSRANVHGQAGDSEVGFETWHIRGQFRRVLEMINESLNGRVINFAARCEVLLGLPLLFELILGWLPRLALLLGMPAKARGNLHGLNAGEAMRAQYPNRTRAAVEVQAHVQCCTPWDISVLDAVHELVVHKQHQVAFRSDEDAEHIARLQFTWKPKTTFLAVQALFGPRSLQPRLASCWPGLVQLAADEVPRRAAELGDASVADQPALGQEIVGVAIYLLVGCGPREIAVLRGRGTNADPEAVDPAGVVGLLNEDLEPATVGRPAERLLRHHHATEGRL
mmetsp:Transcript_38679/g.106536  ORF Transcript_38679/g.106536 Transcript_38679/m.106536 type:complete len:420 (-) Transcript_38679:825-2084(-)